MKLAEKIIAGLIILTFAMKMALIPGGNVLLVLLMSLLANIYFVAGFAFFNGIRLRNIFKKESYKGISTLRIIGAIATGICLSNLVMGLLFIVLYWPGGAPMIYMTYLPLIVILTLVIVKVLKNKEEYYKRILIRIAVIGGISSLFVIMPRETLFDLQYRDYPRYTEAYYEYQRNPSLETEAKLDLEYHRMTLNPGDFKDYQEYLNRANENR